MLFGINEILDTYILRKDYSEYNEYSRRKTILKKKINPLIIKYLVESFCTLKIEVGCRYAGNIMDLMERRLLEGWCWETTESAVVFLKDDDYIERGYLRLDKKREYYHSWICFDFEGREYVFDPCLNLLCEKEIFDKVYQVRVCGSVKAIDVKRDLIDKLLAPKRAKTDSDMIFERSIRRFMGEEEYLRQKDEITIRGNNDVTSPMYRNSTGYKGVVEDGKIKSLTAHFYSRD